MRATFWKLPVSWKQLYSPLLHKILGEVEYNFFTGQIQWEDYGKSEKKQGGPAKESKPILCLKKLLETGLQKQWIKTFN